MHGACQPQSEWCGRKKERSQRLEMEAVSLEEAGNNLSEREELVSQEAS